MIALILALSASLGAEPPAAPAQAADEPGKKVCKKITYTGSRLGAVNVCKTRKEWDEIQWEHDHLLRDRQQLDRALNNNG